MPADELLRHRRREKAASSIGPRITTDSGSDDDDDGAGRISTGGGVATTSSASPGIGRTMLSSESIYDPNKSIENIFAVSITGTMAEFAADAARASSSLVSHIGALHYLKGVPLANGEMDFGDPTRGYITRACVLFTENDFPVDIIFSSEALHGNYIASGRTEKHQRGFFIAPKAKTFTPTGDMGEIRCKPKMDDLLLQKYGHVTPESANVGVYELNDTEGDWVVPPTNPLVHILMVNRLDRATGKPAFRMEKLERNGRLKGWIIDTPTLEKAKQAFYKLVLPAVQITDMSSVKIHADRARDTWKAPIDGLDNPELYETPFTVTVYLKLVYRLIFKSEIPE